MIKVYPDPESLSRAAATFLRACVIARRNILVSGGTGSGKTTLLNALATAIPAHERVITVEDTAELKLRADHVVRLEAKAANTDFRSSSMVLRSFSMRILSSIGDLAEVS